MTNNTLLFIVIAGGIALLSRGIEREVLKAFKIKGRT